MTSVVRVIIAIVSVIQALDVRWLTLASAKHQEKDYHAKYEPL